MAYCKRDFIEHIEREVARRDLVPNKDLVRWAVPRCAATYKKEDSMASFEPIKVTGTIDYGTETRINFANQKEESTMKVYEVIKAGLDEDGNFIDPAVVLKPVVAESAPKARDKAVAREYMNGEAEELGVDFDIRVRLFS